MNIISITGNTRAALETTVKFLKTGSNADQLKLMNIAVITEEGRINGFFYQAAPPETDGTNKNGGISKFIFSPADYPLYLLIIVLIVIAGLLLWPIFFHKKNE